MNVVVEAIPARKGGILTYTRELVRTLPRLLGSSITLVAPREAVPPDGAGSVVVREPSRLQGAIGSLVATAPAVRRALESGGDPVLFASANFTLQPRRFPQLLLMRNPIYFDPLYAEHVLSRVPARTRVSNELRSALCLASGEVARHVLTPTGAMRDMVVRARPELAGRVEACRYGVDLARFRAVAALRTPSERGTLKIVAHSFIAFHKPTWPILAGVREVRRRGVAATLTMLDNPFDPVHQGTPGIEDDRRLAQAGLDEGWLTIAGRLAHEKVPALLAAHDVFAFHTVTESFGHPYVEAMASGLSSVVTDIPTARELCGEAAAYVPLFDGRAFAERFEELAEEPDRRAALGARGIAAVDGANLTWERHFGRVATILRALARGEAVPAP